MSESRINVYRFSVLAKEPFTVSISRSPMVLNSGNAQYFASYDEALRVARVLAELYDLELWDYVGASKLIVRRKTS